MATQTLLLSLALFLPQASAALDYAVVESGRMKVVAAPSNLIVQNSSVLLSCVYDYTNETDAGGSSMSLLVGGIFCFTDCGRRNNKRCNSLQSAECRVVRDEESRRFNVSYLVPNVDGTLNGKRISCSFSTSSAGITLFIKSPPKITESYANSDRVVLGRELLVNCSFVAQDLLTVRWFRNEQPFAVISLDNSTLQDTDNLPFSSLGSTVQLSQLQQDAWLTTLRVSHTNATHAGHYRCQTDTVYGSASGPPVAVDILAPVGSLSLLVHVDSFAEGLNATLRCVALAGTPPFTFRIYENHTEVTELSQSQGEGNSLSVPLTLLRRHNAASFFCSASNFASDQLFARPLVSSSTNFTVNFAPEPVRPLVTDLPKLIIEGNHGIPINLTCSFPSASFPPVDLLWYRDQQLVTDGTIRVLDEAQYSGTYVNSTLIIQPEQLIRSSNYWNYRCEVRYQAKVVSTSENRTVTILFPPRQLTILPSETIVKRRVGETLTLECQAEDSNPATSVRWSILHENGSAVLNDSRQSVRFETRTNSYGGMTTISTSTIERLTLLDNNLKFVCSFECDQFANNLSTQVIVLDIPQVSIRRDRQDVAEGDELTLECVTSGGNPSDPALFNFSWWLDGSVLQSSERSLRLRADAHRIGAYECRVESPAGLASARHYLDLRYAARCERDCESQHAMPLGYDYSLRFSLTSNPPPASVSWFRVADEQSVEISLACPDRCSWTWNASSRSRSFEVLLRFHNVSDADNGSYVCVVTHELGIRNFTFFVVTYIPSAVNDSVKTLSGDLVLILSCVLAGCVAITIAVTLIVLLRRRAKAARRRRSVFVGEENDAENELDLPACSTLRFQDELTKAGFRKASNIFENFVPTYRSVQTCSSASDSALGGSTPEPCESDTLLLKHSDDHRPEPIPEEGRRDGDNLSLYDNVEGRDWVCQPIKNAVLMYQHDTQSVDRRRPEEQSCVNPLATERRHKARVGPESSNQGLRVCQPVGDAVILLKR